MSMFVKYLAFQCDPSKQYAHVTYVFDNARVLFSGERERIGPRPEMEGENVL